MKRNLLIEKELREAVRIWPDSVDAPRSEQLSVLAARYELSVRNGDLLLLNGHWYVTHTGLLGLAHRKHCRGMHTQAVQKLCDPTASRWAPMVRDVVIHPRRREAMKAF